MVLDILHAMLAYSVLENWSLRTRTFLEDYNSDLSIVFMYFVYLFCSIITWLFVLVSIYCKPYCLMLLLLASSDVKSSRSKWPRGQNFGLGLKALASTSRFWSRPGLDLVVLLCNRVFFVQKSVKIRKFC